MTGNTRCGQELDGKCIDTFRKDGDARVANVVLLA